MACETSDEIYDYEEGEILDEELDVSVCSEDSNIGERGDWNEIEQDSPSSPPEQGGRDHICHETSICRKERTGRRCYARIKQKIKEIEKQNLGLSKRQGVSKMGSLAFKDNSSRRGMRQENSNPIRTSKHKTDFIDVSSFMEEKRSNEGKENNCYGKAKYAIPYKRPNSINQRSRFNNRKVTTYTRFPRYLKSSSPIQSRKSSIQKSLKKPMKATQEILKVCKTTSLLKRLEGSGSTGIKVPEIKDFCQKISTELEKNQHPPCSPKDSYEITHDGNSTSNEDYEALRLRAEALRTVIIKKYERKKKGLNRKRSATISEKIDEDLMSEINLLINQAEENKNLPDNQNESNDYKNPTENGIATPKGENGDVGIVPTSWTQNPNGPTVSGTTMGNNINGNQTMHRSSYNAYSNCSFSNHFPHCLIFDRPPPPYYQPQTSFGPGFCFYPPPPNPSSQYFPPFNTSFQQNGSALSEHEQVAEQKKPAQERQKSSPKEIMNNNKIVKNVGTKQRMTQLRPGPVKFSLQAKPEVSIQGNILDNLKGKRKTKWDSPPPPVPSMVECKDSEKSVDESVLPQPKTELTPKLSTHTELQQLIQNSSEIIQISSSSEDENEEVKLRELALLSFKDRKLSTKRKLSSSKSDAINSDRANMIESGISEELTKESKPEMLKRGGDREKLEVKQIESLSTSSRTCSNESETENIKCSDEDNWDEVDEDILRAQLLTSLSKNIPTTKDPAKVVSLTVTPTINKSKKKKMTKTRKVENKWAVIKRQRLLKKSLPGFKGNIAKGCHEFLVKTSTGEAESTRFIISVNDSSDSGDEEESQQNSGYVDIESSVDKLLNEARNKIDPKISSSTPQTSKKESCKSQLKNSHVTIVKKMDKMPIAVKHLPTPKQQEYQRLKLHLAKREQSQKLVLLKKELNLLYNKVAHRKLGADRTTAEELTVVKTPVTKTSYTPEISIPSSIQSKSEGSPKQKNNIYKTEVETNNEIEKKLLETKESILNSTRIKILLGIKKMSNLVEKMEKEKAEFICLQQELVHLKEELESLETKLAEQTAKILEKKDTLMGFGSIVTQQVLKSTTLEESCINLGKKTKGPGYKPPGGEADNIRGKILEILTRADALCVNLPQKEACTSKLISKRKHLGVLPNAKRKKIGESTEMRKCGSNNLRNEVTVPGGTVTSTSDTLPSQASQCDANISSKQLFIPSRVESRTGKWDPLWAVCPFDISGTCKDPQCKHQHFKPCDRAS